MAEFSGNRGGLTKPVFAKQAGYIRSFEISKKNMSYNKLISQINDQTKAPMVIPPHMFGFKWGDKTNDPIPMLSVITGKSGVGKSSLLNLIRYYFNDKDTSKLPFKAELNDPESPSLDQIDETCIDLVKINGNVNLKDSNKLGALFHNRFSRNKEVNLNCDLYDSCITDDNSGLNFVNHGRLKYLFTGKENQENKAKINERLKKKKFKFYLEIDTDNDDEMVFKRLNNPNSSLKLKNLSVKEQLTFFQELLKLNLKSNTVENQSTDGDPSVKFMNLGKIINMIKVNLNADLVTINSQLEAKGFRYLIDLDSYKEIVFTEKSKNSKKKSTSNQSEPATKRYKLSDLAPSEQLLFFEKMAKLFDSSKKSDSMNLNNFNLLDLASIKSKFLGTDGTKNLQKINEKLKKEKKFPYEIGFEKQVEFVARLRNSPDTKLKLQCLSSSEQLILLGHLWELNRGQFSNHFNKLVLLIDEADLNMHPKDLSDFIRLVIEILVNQMKIQVILNTNHPTIISYLVKENLNSCCLFEMYEDADEIKIARDHESPEDLNTIDYYLNKIGIFMPNNYEQLISANPSPGPYLTNQNQSQPLSSIVEENMFPEAQSFSLKDDQELMYDSVYATINDRNISADTSRSVTPQQTTPVAKTPLNLQESKEPAPAQSLSFNSSDIFIRTAVNATKRRLVTSQNETTSYGGDSADEQDKSILSNFSRTSKRNRSDLHPLVPIYNILAERNVLENKKTLQDYQRKHNKLFDIES